MAQYTEIVKNSLAERYEDFSQLEDAMSKRIMDKFGNPRERESGILEQNMQVGINSVINKLKSGFQQGDEIWLWINNPNVHFSEEWGYATMRDGETTNLEILGRS